MKLMAVSAGHHLHTVREGEPLPDLTPILKQVCRERPRRVDRFIELALLGSGLCVQGRQLKPDCGLYLGSGFGPKGSNVAVQQQLLRDRECPKPFDFMNILGASAGFHVARNLGLTGPNVFISRRGASLEAALAVAQADMQLGIVSQALLGVVEEVTLPLDQHRQRHEWHADTPVAEGSHWLLLEKDGTAGKPLRSVKLSDLKELEDYLQAYYLPSGRIYWSLGGETTVIGALSQRFIAHAPTDSGIHDSQPAAWVAEYAVRDESGPLLLIGKGPGESYRLLHLGA